MNALFFPQKTGNPWFIPQLIWGLMSKQQQTRFMRRRKFFHPCLVLLRQPIKVVTPCWKVTVNGSVHLYSKTKKEAMDYIATFAHDHFDPKLHHFDLRTKQWSIVKASW